MAQLVARLNGIQKVRGSNPLSSTKREHPNISDSFSFYGCSDMFDFSPPMLSKSERQENGILSPAVSQALRHTGKEKELRTNCCSFFYYFFTRAAHRKSHRLT